MRLTPMLSLASNSFSTAISTLAFVLLAQGCGGLQSANHDSVSADTYYSHVSGATTTNGTGDGATDTSGDDEFNCPSSANIKPWYDWDHDGTMSFIACPSATNTARVKFLGTGNLDDQICFFPAQYIDSEHILAKRDANSFPIYQCTKLNADLGTIFDIPSVVYNAGFVADWRDRLQMQRCLASGVANDCPHYFGYGKFR